MQRRAYTLIELLAVLATVATVAVLLLPPLTYSARQSREAQNARRASCQSNLKQIGLGILQYTQDYDEKYPPASISKSTRGGSQAYGWADAIQPYVKSTQLLQCPEDRHPSGGRPDHIAYTDYWLNRNHAGRSLHSTSAPTKTLMLGDGDGASRASTARYAIKSLPLAWSKTPRSPARRHLDGANYAFADGHVKWLKPTHIFTAKTKTVASGSGTFSIN